MTHTNSYYIPFDVTTVHGAHNNMSPLLKMVIKLQVAEFLTFCMFDVYVTVHHDKFLIREPNRCTNF